MTKMKRTNNGDFLLNKNISLQNKMKKLTKLTVYCGVITTIITIISFILYLNDKPKVGISIGKKEIPSRSTLYMYYLCPYTTNENKYLLDFSFSLYNKSNRTAKDFAFYLQCNRLPIEIEGKDVFMSRFIYYGDTENLWKEKSTNNESHDMLWDIHDIKPHTRETGMIMINSVLQDFSKYSSFLPFDNIDFKISMVYDNSGGTWINVYILPILVEDTKITNKVKEKIRKLSKNKKGRIFIVSTSKDYENVTSIHCEINDIVEL